jgi:hypothetical protein
MSNRSLNLKILKSLSLGVVLLAGAGAVSTDGWGAPPAGGGGRGLKGFIGNRMGGKFQSDTSLKRKKDKSDYETEKRAAVEAFKAGRPK